MSLGMKTRVLTGVLMVLLHLPGGAQDVAKALPEGDLLRGGYRFTSGHEGDLILNLGVAKLISYKIQDEEHATDYEGEVVSVTEKEGTLTARCTMKRQWTRGFDISKKKPFDRGWIAIDNFDVVLEAKQVSSKDAYVLVGTIRGEGTSWNAKNTAGKVVLYSF
jgi:hypothetical protein